MKPYLRKLAAGEILTEEEAEGAMHLLMRGEARPEEIAAFLLGLRSRGEHVDELTGFARVMRAYAVPVTLPDPHAIDLCGTGGDQAGTFNISTTAAFVCAGAGVTVAKHGNRSVSSRSGSADVLEALGIWVNLPREGVEYCLEHAGIAFLFAPNFHPAMRHVMPVRRLLGVRTFFNILGPLANPAGVERQLVGAFSEEVAETMAQILARLGARRAVTVHGGGLDEVSLSAPTRLFKVEEGQVAGREEFTPETFGSQRVEPSELQGGDAETNARILLEVLSGTPGPRREVVLLNAAWALWTSGRFSSLRQAYEAAVESIDSGAALRKVEALRTYSQQAPVTQNA